MARLLTPFAAALALALPQAAAAQTAAPAAAPAAKVDPAYYTLFDVITGGLDIDVLAANGADQVFDGLVRNEAGFADLAEADPGLKDRFRTATKPFFVIWMNRAIGLRRDRVAIAFASALTPAEAKDLIGFYTSPIGRKMMKAVSNNLVSDSQIDTAFEKDDPGVNKAARAQDHQVTVKSAMADLMPGLTPDEIRQLEAFGKTPGFRKMDTVKRVLDSIPEPSFEEISTPAERDAFRKAIVGALMPAVSGS